MTLGVRSRPFLASLGLIAVSLLIADAYLSSALERTLTRRIREDLEARLALVERDASLVTATQGDLAAWDAMADDLGMRARARVTLMGTDGRVLGDSAVDAGALAEEVSQSQQPEVVGALTAGRGAAMRPSASTHERLMFVAVPFARGVVRAALPLTEVEAAVARARWLLVLASLVALGVSILLAWGVAGRLSSSVREVTDAARRMASGRLDARARLPGAGEIAELGRTLDQLASSLETTVAELRSERDRMSGILEAMHEGVLVIDSERRVSLVNSALREMLLLDRDVVGRSPLEVIRHAELKGILDQAWHSDEVVGEIEVQGVKPRRLLVRASPLHAEPGGVLVVVVDVTDLRRLEGLRRDFVANVSHELRTPVTTIRSAVETLRGGAAQDAEAGPRFLDIVERNAARLQQLVEDLLDLSRIESRQYKLNPEAVELSAVLGHAVGLLRERAEKKQVSVEVDTPGDLPAARADRRALEQVVANLIDNAVKYTGPRCHVTVHARAASDRVLEVGVSDDGPGIEAKHLPRLFERFYRVDAGRSREEGGTGLGLSIVKHLVEAMGGRVRVESQPGEKTTFSFTLPRA